MAYRHSTKVLSRQRNVSEDVCASLTDRAEAHAASPGLSTVVRFKLTSISLLFFTPLISMEDEYFLSCLLDYILGNKSYFLSLFLSFLTFKRRASIF